MYKKSLRQRRGQFREDETVVCRPARAFPISHWNFHFIYFAHLHYPQAFQLNPSLTPPALAPSHLLFHFFESCLAGFAGELCNFEYNECESNPCQNGGECIDHIGSYECRCTKGFSGNRCQIKVSEQCRIRLIQNTRNQYLNHQIIPSKLQEL